MLIFIFFKLKILCLAEFGPNIQKNQFKTKLGIACNLLINEYTEYTKFNIQKQLLTSVKRAF